MFLQIRTRWDVTFDPGEVSSLAILIAEVSRTRLVAISRIQKVYTKDQYIQYVQYTAVYQYQVYAVKCLLNPIWHILRAELDRATPAI